ncbi:MAG: glycosyltransferase family 2 protein [Methylocapsa sp.]|nr:glycosyltransferase family 2 protein [Methylocapsa sp.]
MPGGFARAKDADPASDPSGAQPPFRLPLVSVIVVNFNYGRFLPATVQSVFGQTYPHVECIAVDNASTDESAAVLRELAARHPNLKVIFRTENAGQTPAALEGLAASSGPYVIFLDADDFLLPRCIETHVFVHLSLRVHVGFTSADMLQLAGDQVVLGTEHDFNRVLRTRRGARPRAVRPYLHPIGETWPRPGFDTSVLDALRFVRRTRQWVWAPTSGNCFRRDALALFADNPALLELRTGTDLYFCVGINAVSGSVLIDRPLAVYRMHGNNIFTQRPQLNNVLPYKEGGAGDSNRKARAILVDHLAAHAGRLVGRGWVWIEFLWLLFRLDCSNPEPGAPYWSRRSRGAAALVTYYDSISRVVGSWAIKLWLALHLVPPNIILGLGQKGKRGVPPKGR